MSLEIGDIGYLYIFRCFAAVYVLIPIDYILATTCRIPLAWALHPWGITPLHTKCLNRASIGWSTLALSRACILSANSAPRSCISSCNTYRDFSLLVILLLVSFLSLPVPPVFAPTYLSSPPLSSIFPIIYGNNHSNWLIFFRGIETTNQQDIAK